ncbi:MAG: succinate dehydrogenase cytochrome b subunit [Bdellovibrionales bacterium]|nr:succinate dehydrogenase cytochrome b subunit [Bdellovibrionales bacterium]
MTKILHFYRSTIGKKVIVAVSGLSLLLFVVGHVTGNLKAFGGIDPNGQPHLDAYAHFLRTAGSELFGYGGLLWIARIGLLLMLVLHVTAIIQLQALNAKARPVQYRQKQHRASSFAARYMFVGGLILFAFIIYHLLHFTTGTLHNSFIEGQVYHNVYIAFQNPLILVIYTIAMIALGFHLFHGTWSLFQTLGIDSPDKNTILRAVATVLACLVAVGFLAVPYAMFFGILGKPPL